MHVFNVFLYATISNRLFIFVYYKLYFGMAYKLQTHIVTIYKPLLFKLVFIIVNKNILSRP